MHAGDGLAGLVLHLRLLGAERLAVARGEAVHHVFLGAYAVGGHDHADQGVAVDKGHHVGTVHEGGPLVARHANLAHHAVATHFNTQGGHVAAVGGALVGAIGQRGQRAANLQAIQHRRQFVGGAILGGSAGPRRNQQQAGNGQPGEGVFHPDS